VPTAAATLSWSILTNHPNVSVVARVMHVNVELAVFLPFSARLTVTRLNFMAHRLGIKERPLLDL
jgi:hypothetical protein